jgi:hypothetical protein
MSKNEEKEKQTKMKNEPDLFNPNVSWDELTDMWAKAQRGMTVNKS